MCKIIVSILLASCLGIALADHHLIAAGCNTDKQCFQFSDCSQTTNPTTPNLATIYMNDASTVEFQLQYNNSNAGWIAIGISDTPVMPNTYIFMCVRPDSTNVNVQTRFASANARPPIVTEFGALTEVNSFNDGSLFNCTFTSPINRTPQLNAENGYFVLLAWGRYDSGDIQQHAGAGVGRCATSNRIAISTPITPIAAGCNTADKQCFQFSDCSQTTNPTTPNLATIYMNDASTVEFQLQYNNSNAGWIAIGISDTPVMPNTYIFMCVRPDSTNVNVQTRFASANARPPIVTEFGALTEVNSFNDGSLFNCTFTSPINRTPQLNAENGYFVLLAWGRYDSGDIQQHAGAGVGRCATSNRIAISTPITPIAAGCNTADKRCFQFSDCSQTTNPTTPNLATIYTTDASTVEFQLQYNNSNAGWIAIGISDTPVMPNTYIFMCVRPDSTNVNVQTRFASANALPPIDNSNAALTEVNSFNDGSLFNCTFTSPIDRTPPLNANYFVLLAWGRYNSGDIQQHAGAGVGRCVTQNTITISGAPIISVSVYALVLMLILIIFV